MGYGDLKIDETYIQVVTMVAAFMRLLYFLTYKEIKISPLGVCVVEVESARRNCVSKFKFQAETRIVKNLKLTGVSVKNLCVLLITGSDNFAQFSEQLLALFRSCSQDLVCIYLLTEKDCCNHSDFTYRFKN